MFEREITLNKFMITYVLQLVQDIPEELWYHTTSHYINSPGWCIGHLTTECDHALVKIGKERVCPSTWDLYFLQGTKPAEDNSLLPRKSALADAFQLSYKRLRHGAQKVQIEAAAQPSHSKFLKKFLPEFGDWLSHMLTTHLAMHAGNIATWKRVSGMTVVSQTETTSF